LIRNFLFFHNSVLNIVREIERDCGYSSINQMDQVSRRVCCNNETQGRSLSDGSDLMSELGCTVLSYRALTKNEKLIKAFDWEKKYVLTPKSPTYIKSGVKVADIPIEAAVIDTGAGPCCMKTSFFNKHFSKILPLAKNEIYVHGVDGKSKTPW